MSSFSYSSCFRTTSFSEVNESQRKLMRKQFYHNTAILSTIIITTWCCSYHNYLQKSNFWPVYNIALSAGSWNIKWIILADWFATISFNINSENLTVHRHNKLLCPSWSFPLSSSSVCLTTHWYCKEKLVNFWFSNKCWQQAKKLATSRFNFWVASCFLG